MNQVEQITKAIQFRIEELDKAFVVFEKTNAPTVFIKECNHRIDELESLLDHINKELSK